MGNKTNVAVGDKFGNRTIIEFVESNNKHRKVKVRCDCGKEEIIQLSNCAVKPRPLGLGI